MKLSILLSFLPAAAAATKGIHLRQIPVPEKTTLDVFQSVVEVLEQCSAETTALAECYRGYTPMLACGECAWTRILSEINQGCDDIDDIAVIDYHSCIDNPNSACNNECHDEVVAVWSCAKAMYCGQSEEISFSERGGDLPEFTCFSLESTVEVKGKGTTPIKDLVIGDMVLSDEHGTYTKFYSVAHVDKNAKTQFLRIFTDKSTNKPLEVTPSHLIYKAYDALPVPASSVMVGDILQTINGPSEITFIKHITRKGFYNAFTASGTMIVDGVVTSNHCVQKGTEGVEVMNDGWLYIFNHKMIHHHTITRIIYAPHRVVCGHLITCPQDSLEDEFSPSFSQNVGKILDVARDQQSFLFTAFVLATLVTVGALFSMLEFIILQHAIVFAGIVGVWLVSKKFNKKEKTKVA